MSLITSHPSISIVIPVRNEGKNLRQCLESWLNQSIKVDQIIVIDSGSTDDTVSIAESYEKVYLHEIPASDFNHGATRNLAMQFVKSEFTLMTVGDGRAADPYVLSRMLGHFDSDQVAGVCGLQIVPHDADKNPIDWFRPQTVPKAKRYCFDEIQEFESLSPSNKLEIASWDDVIALYRTRVLREVIPFRVVTYGEDPVWALDALRAGYSIVYEPAGCVYHYHLETPEATYRRTITMLCLRNFLFGVIPEARSLSWVARIKIVKTLLKSSGLSIYQKWRWYIYNVVNQKEMYRAKRDFLRAHKQGSASVRELHDRCAGKPFKVQ